MAKPQKENGHLDLANEIVDKLCTYRLSGEEWQVLLCIWRKTYCWHKKQDAISMSQFSKMTGLTRPAVSRSLSKLLSKKIIAVIKKDNTLINFYEFNKNYDDWVLTEKKKRGVKGVIKIDNGVLSKKIHTKETITKERIMKNNIYSPTSKDGVIKKDNTKEEKTKSEVDQVIEIFYLTVNPTIAWGNTTTRKAAADLIKSIGFEKTINTAKYAVSIQTEQFAPVITTPYQLKEKLAQLINYHNRQTAKTSSKVGFIPDTTNL